MGARWARSAVELEEAAVDGIVGAGDECGFVTAQKERQVGYFARLRHPPDRLRFGKLFEKFGFAARIILAQVAVDEGSVDAGGADAVAADIVMQIVAGYGIGHGNYRAF